MRSYDWPVRMLICLYYYLGFLKMQSCVCGAFLGMWRVCGLYACKFGFRATPQGFFSCTLLLNSAETDSYAIQGTLFVSAHLSEITPCRSDVVLSVPSVKTTKNLSNLYLGLWKHQLCCQRRHKNYEKSE